MHFGEYELSPSLISLSPLPSAHPEAFQRLLVRSSSWCYPAFNLAKGRSLGFASATADYAPYSDSLSLRIRVSSHLTLPAKATRRFIMQKARRHCFKQLRPLVGARFQELFHSSVRSAFHLSLTVLLLYRSSGSILAWRVVPPASHGIPRAPRYSGSGYVHFIFDYVALTLFDWPSQTIRLTKLTDIAVHNPAHIATYGLASSDFARHYFRNLG